MHTEIRKAAEALASVARTAEKGLPEGMEILPGYTFPVCLDELVAQLGAWADATEAAGL